MLPKLLIKWKVSKVDIKYSILVLEVSYSRKTGSKMLKYDDISLVCNALINELEQIADKIFEYKIQSRQIYGAGHIYRSLSPSLC